MIIPSVFPLSLPAVRHVSLFFFSRSLSNQAKRAGRGIGLGLGLGCVAARRRCDLEWQAKRLGFGRGTPWQAMASPIKGRHWPRVTGTTRFEIEPSRTAKQQPRKRAWAGQNQDESSAASASKHGEGERTVIEWARGARGRRAFSYPLSAAAASRRVETAASRVDAHRSAGDTSFQVSIGRIEQLFCFLGRAFDGLKVGSAPRAA